MGFKAWKNNADDPGEIFVELQSKRYRGNIRARRSCLTSVRAVKFTLLAFLWLRPHRKTDKNFRHTFLFQAETNVVIFSQTLHVESNTVTVSYRAVTARRLKQVPTPALGTCPARASRTGTSLPCSSENSSM
ncbi:Uncharacterised protein [Escherichia coli]|nr:Uncharacterised protein [Escherichia coli]